MDKNRLKKCPFCGSKGKVWILSKRFFVKCSSNKCRAHGGGFEKGMLTPTKEAIDRAISLWNRRST